MTTVSTIKRGRRVDLGQFKGSFNGGTFGATRDPFHAVVNSDLTNGEQRFIVALDRSDVRQMIYALIRIQAPSWCQNVLDGAYRARAKLAMEGKLPR